jgi:hypothetical protein
MIKAISTEYKGYKFRSRLEARFAVFLDAMEIAWDYEIEGFDLPINGRYLPDFYLRNGGLAPGYIEPMWIEVKATKPTNTEVDKLRELAVTTKTVGAFFQGTYTTGINAFRNFLDPAYSPYYGLPVIHCVQFPLDFFVPSSERMPANYWSNEENKMAMDHWVRSLYGELPLARLRKAAKAALSARFEFGESG